QHSPGTPSARWPRLLNALVGATCGGLIAACGGDAGANGDGGTDAATQDAAHGEQDGATGGAERDGATGGSADAGAAGGSDASGATQDASTTRDSGAEAACLAATLLDPLGIGHTLVGASMDDDSAKAAPFDARYLYLAGGLFDGDRACTSCASGCSAGGVSCANGGEGCAWWGCWQYDQDPPGAYVRDFVARAKADKQIPMISYYELLQASGLDEGEEQVKALNDAALMRRYLADFAFVLDQIGDERALVHIEPDLWAYAQQLNQNPASIPARVASANDECKSYENNVAGLGRCMIHLVRVHAPNARVGLHGSGWATGVDVLGNGDSSLDVAGEARKLAAFLGALGAGDSDFIGVDASDRDAAWYDTQGRETWWDATNKTLPNFKQAFSWAKGLAEAVKKPVLWWQVPVGNMQLPNQQNRWKDNRLDYFLDHPDEVAASHGAGMLFGAGDGNQTTPDTDSGHLIARMKSYAGKPQRTCP
ncbi:MAG TPA: hypothetical protein VFZ61_26000, partial [Polyangiales bacterium]